MIFVLFRVEGLVFGREDVSESALERVVSNGLFFFFRRLSLEMATNERRICVEKLERETFERLLKRVVQEGKISMQVALMKKTEEKIAAEQQWQRFKELKVKCERLLKARAAYRNAASRVWERSGVFDTHSL